MQQRSHKGGAAGATASRRDMEPYHDIVSSVFEHNIDEMERILRTAAQVRFYLLPASAKPVRIYGNLWQYKLFLDIRQRSSDYCRQTGVGWLKSSLANFF